MYIPWICFSCWGRQYEKRKTMSFSFFVLPSAVRKTNPRYIHGPSGYKAISYGLCGLTDMHRRVTMISKSRGLYGDKHSCRELYSNASTDIFCLLLVLDRFICLLLEYSLESSTTVPGRVTLCFMKQNQRERVIGWLHCPTCLFVCFSVMSCIAC